MKYCFLFVLACTVCSGYGQNLYFPPAADSSWESSSLEELQWCASDTGDLFNFLESENTKAFIVLKDGKIAIEKYFDQFTRDSVWYWASAGKTLTAFCTGIAQKQGLLDIDDPVSQYLGAGWTSAPDSLESKIKIIHLLTMTSGLDYNVADLDCTDDTCLNYRSEPGSEWYYYNAPYLLLREVIEAATGQNLNVFINQQIRDKTGIRGLFTTIGYNHVYFSDARSMARFGLLMNARGNWNSTPVLDDIDFLNESISPSQNLNESYGYLWWLSGQNQFMAPGFTQVFPGSFAPDTPKEMFSGLGLNGQIVSVWPDENIIVVRMGNAPGAESVPFQLLNEIWKRLERVIDCEYTSAKNTQTENSNDFNVFPNPANDHLNVEAGANFSNIKIFNSSGEIVYTNFYKNTSRVKIALHALKPGIYIVASELNGVIMHRKFIKMSE